MHQPRYYSMPVTAPNFLPRQLPLKITLSKQGHIQSLQQLFLVILETNLLQAVFPLFFNSKTESKAAICGFNELI